MVRIFKKLPVSDRILQGGKCYPISDLLLGNLEEKYNGVSHGALLNFQDDISLLLQIRNTLLEFKEFKNCLILKANVGLI